MHQSPETTRIGTGQMVPLGAAARFQEITGLYLAFILGVVPLVIATGAGAEMRQALGTAVFGMLGVTLFGLLFTPVFYVLVRRIGTLGARRQPEGRELTPAAG
jgi:multidrug efflux pump